MNLKTIKETLEDRKNRTSSGEFWYYKKPRGISNKKIYTRKMKFKSILEAHNE